MPGPSYKAKSKGGPGYTGSRKAKKVIRQAKKVALPSSQVQSTPPELPAQRARLARWARSEGEGRGPMPRYRGKPLVEWLQQNDPKRIYYEDGTWVPREGVVRPKRTARRRAERLWERAKVETGLRGEMPPIVLNAKRNPKLRGWVQAGIIFLRPKTTEGLARNQDPAKSVLLHEFAHTQQTMSRSRPNLAEGLATRFERRVAKKLGITPATTTRRYRRYARRSRRRYGPRYVIRGQFR